MWCSLLTGNRHLHSLTVAARMQDLAYSSRTQASVEDILVAIQTDLRNVLEVFDAHVKEALDRRIEILQQTGDTDESMETISNPGSLVRTSTQMLGKSDDGIFLEDSLLGEGSSEEEKIVETNLEASWRKDVEMLDAMVMRVLHASWQEANKIMTKAEEEAAKYKKSGEGIVKKAEEKGNFLMNAYFSMIKTTEILAMRIKDDAFTCYNAEEGKVREIKEWIEEEKRMREDKKKELGKEKERQEKEEKQKKEGEKSKKPEEENAKEELGK